MKNAKSYLTLGLLTGTIGLGVTACGTYIGGAPILNADAAHVGRVQVSKDSPVWAVCREYSNMHPVSIINGPDGGGGNTVPATFNSGIWTPQLTADSTKLYSYVYPETAIHPWFATDIATTAHDLHELLDPGVRDNGDRMGTIEQGINQLSADCASFHTPHAAAASTGPGFDWMNVLWGVLAWFLGMFPAKIILTLMNRNWRKDKPYSQPYKWDLELAVWPLYIVGGLIVLTFVNFNRATTWLQYTPAERKAIKDKRLADNLAKLQAEEDEARMRDLDL